MSVFWLEVFARAGMTLFYVAFAMACAAWCFFAFKWHTGKEEPEEVDFKKPQTEAERKAQARLFPPYTLGHDGQSITCRYCDKTSYHPIDVSERYCGNCHVYLDYSEVQAAEQTGKPIFYP